MVINSSTFIQDSVLFIRDMLVSALTDPISSSRVGNEKFVMTNYPKRDVKYPVVTVKMLNSPGSVRLGMRSEEIRMPMNVECRIWARNVVERDNLAQATINAIRSRQTETSTGTIANNLYDFEVSSIIDIDEPDAEGSGLAGVKSKIIEFNFFVILTN